DEIEKVFRPEFIGRCNDVIVFRHLQNKDLQEIVDLELSKITQRLSEKGLTLELSDESKQFLIKKGSNTDFGARPLRRSIESAVEGPLAEEPLKGEFAGKDLVKVEVKKVGGKKQLVFTGLATKSHEEAQPVGASVAQEGDEGENPTESNEYPG